MTCAGCHQSRTIAGFHLLGKDPPDVAAGNALAVYMSSHLHDEIDRRSRVLDALAEGRPPDYSRPLAERGPTDKGQSGSRCGLGGLGDPGFASWTCAEGLTCNPYDTPADDRAVGTCWPADEMEVGDPCEFGPLNGKRDSRRDRMSKKTRHKCADDAVCNTNRYGFPGGMCTSSCEDLPAKGACGVIALLHPFNMCIARKDPVPEMPGRARGSGRAARLRLQDAVPRRLYLRAHAGRRWRVHTAVLSVSDARRWPPVRKPPHEPPHKPTEFRYRENLNRPWARRVRALGRSILGFDPAPSNQVVDTFAAMYNDADPLAEAFVHEVYLGRGVTEGRAMLDQALSHGVDTVAGAPPSLRALFADIEADPPWLEPALVARGARAFRRFGIDVFRFAGAVTLEAYSENSVAKPLALTGVYAGKSTKRRFLETAAFWIDVSEPDALEPGGIGRHTAMRVRIMHVFVRQRLSAHPEWDRLAWGVPISQADALLTLMGGSLAPGIALHLLGYRSSARDIEAMMHFWRYVGHLMGVRPRFYPRDIREGLQLGFVALVKASHRAGDDGRLLCRSYRDAFEPEPGAGGSPSHRLRAEIDAGMHRAFVRLFTTPRGYRHNRLPAAGPWTLAPLAGAPVRLVAETLRQRWPALDRLADRRARAHRRRWLDFHLGERSAEYKPVLSFTR